MLTKSQGSSFSSCGGLETSQYGKQLSQSSLFHYFDLRLRSKFGRQVVTKGRIINKSWLNKLFGNILGHFHSSIHLLKIFSHICNFYIQDLQIPQISPKQSSGPHGPGEWVHYYYYCAEASCACPLPPELLPTPMEASLYPRTLPLPPPCATSTLYYNII